MGTGPLTPDEEQQITALHAEGIACKEIARRLGRSPSTISKAARRLGLAFDRAQTAAAAHAKKIDGKARRAELAALLLEDAHRLREQLWEPCVVHSFGGRDNTYAEAELDEPPFRDKRDIMHSVHTALRGHADLERLDADTGADAAKSMLGQLGEALQIAADQLGAAPAEPDDGDG